MFLRKIRGLGKNFLKAFVIKKMKAMILILVNPGGEKIREKNTKESGVRKKSRFLPSNDPR